MEQEVFNGFLKVILPIVLRVVAANMQDSELVYLSSTNLFSNSLFSYVTLLSLAWKSLLWSVFLGVWAET